jgi:hypothetical protein
LLLLFILLLAACSSKDAHSADDVSEALHKQGLEVRAISLDEAELLASTPLDINGVLPSAYELTLPTADMAHREFAFVYAFKSEDDRIRTNNSDGSPYPVTLKNLHANTVQKHNLIVIYWSHSQEDKSLLRKQFNTAMDNL